jgi:hypothetical protein
MIECIDQIDGFKTDRQKKMLLNLALIVFTLIQQEKFRSIAIQEWIHSYVFQQRNYYIHMSARYSEQDIKIDIGNMSHKV